MTRITQYKYNHLHKLINARILNLANEMAVWKAFDDAIKSKIDREVTEKDHKYIERLILKLKGGEK